MPTINNIFNIKITSVFNAGSVNFGNTLHKGHTANSKSNGDYAVFGDGTFSMNYALNKSNDPDAIDQPTKQL